MSNVTIQEESIIQIIGEVQPLLARHWDELAVFKSIPLSPDWKHYIQAEHLGRFHAYIARQDGKLIGYLAYFMGYHQHYSTTLVATEDVFFVAPEHRIGFTGLRLLKFAEASLKKYGAELLVHHSKTAHDLGPILIRRGFQATDKLYMKAVGE